MYESKLLSGFTAALLVSTLGLAPSGYADQQQSTDEQSGVSVSESGSAAQVASASALPDSSLENPENAPNQVQAAQPLGQASNGISSATAIPSPSDEKVGEKVSTPAVAPAAAPSTSNSTAAESSGSQPVEVVKVGEYQSQDASRANATVATIQPHPLQGRNAATLYVRNIPVLTFLGEAVGESASGAQANQAASSSSGAEVKVASTQATSGTAAAIQANSAEPLTESTSPIPDTIPSNVSTDSTDSQDPVWRATATAARLNQLYRDNVSADEIKISWDAARQQYVIKAKDTEIVTVDESTVLPDTVANSSGDLLQATNRIRRQMGGASPLAGIEGDPNGIRQVSLGNLNLRFSGYASWYGPGFDGNYSASGEVFNQNALTAAHPSLPFGTNVRVTNMDNGQSVVVRINDRGPFAHDRVIDLSAGAARIIGLIHSGVAPVSLEVLGVAGTASN
ncbi:MAG: septal ring lytic transglycosylase RlpA family protein [Leptolyngbya sp. IPPAS B-1204]